MDRYWAIMLMSSVLIACNEDAPDGTGLVIEMSANQPSSPGFGIALEIHARGGRGIAIAVEQGSFVAPTAANSVRPATTGCFASPSATLDAPFTIGLSVRPAENEAMLYATLYGASDCTDAPIQSRLVAVRPPATNSIDGGPTAREGN